MSDFPFFIIEHTECDFPKEGWSVIEYTNILKIVAPQRLIFTNMSEKHQNNLPAIFKDCAAITSHSVLEFIEGGKYFNDESQPEVLRNIGQAALFRDSVGESSVCFLDEHGSSALKPSDIKLKYIIAGGILGGHPSIDTCSFLRLDTFAVRHLGTRQMSTDTAVLACATILRHQVNIEDLTYSDDPEVYADEIDSVPKTGPMKGYRESTAIRMRYLNHQQSVLHLEQHQPIPLNADLPQYIGDWEKTKPECQQHLSTASVNTPRITPDLLQHIFDSADDGIDFDGVLEILDEEVDEAEKEALDAVLFDY